MKLYHQQADNLNDSDQNIEFIFGENDNYHQIGISYLQFEWIIEKSAVAPNKILIDGDAIRLVNNAFA